MNEVFRSRYGSYDMDIIIIVAEDMDRMSKIHNGTPEIGGQVLVETPLVRFKSFKFITI